MALTSTFSGGISLDALFNEVLTDGGFKRGPVAHEFRIPPIRLPNGATVGKVNKAYADSQAGIGAGVTTSYDLQTVTDTSGTAIALDEVVLIAIKNNSAVAGEYLSVGPNAVNGFGVLGGVTAGKGVFGAAGDLVIIQPKTADSSGGAWFVIYSDTGIPVDASHKVLDVITAAATSSNAWSILVVGRDT